MSTIEQEEEEEEIKPAEEFASRIVEAAKTGTQKGFVIKMGRKTGKSEVDPLTREKVDEIIYDEKKVYRKHSMSAQDYKRYQDVKKQLATETDEDKRVDLTLRLYEYLALKFLGMSHDEFVNADFDDIVVATLACEALFGSGTGSTTSQSQQQQPMRGVNRQIIHTTNPPQYEDFAQQPSPQKRKPPKPKDTYYKAPDEE